MTDRYKFSLNTEGSTATVEVEDTGEGSMFSGTIDLYYTGPETSRSLPKLIDSKRVYYAEQTNIAGGAELEYNVSEEYVEGDGRWTVFVGAEDEPTIDVSAPEARGDDKDGDGVSYDEELHKLRVTLRNERQNRRQAIAELRSEMDVIEERIDEEIPDGGDAVGSGDGPGRDGEKSLTRKILDVILG